jgi:hypothetical protein
MPNTSTNYYTANINLATFLLIKGIKLLEIQPNSTFGRGKTFVFEDPEKCRELEQLFFEGAVAPAKEILEAKRYLWESIRNQDRGNYEA